MSEIELTAQEEQFLQELFKPENKGHITKALKAAGYAANEKAAVMKRLKHIIIERGYDHLAALTPAAVLTAAGLADEDFDPTLKDRFKIAESIMDRVGLSKKESESKTQTTNYIIQLPAKED